MRKVESKQRQVIFSYCPHPVTVDKSAEWGEGNLQHFPNGVFLKHGDDNIITHGVQPKEDASAPIGWVRSFETHSQDEFDKAPIFVNDAFELTIGETYGMLTKDGRVEYDVTEESRVVYNMRPDGEPDLTDGWVVTVRELEKSYEL